MCRLFTFRANQRTRISESLLDAPCSLLRQSGGDRRGQCHDNGWGIGWYEAGRPLCERAAVSAQQDPRYRALAESVCSVTALGHVRQASVGAIVEKNTHPFLHDPWLFAHNGTLQGFAEDTARLRRLISPSFRHLVQGDTDSEHLFYYLLSCLEMEGLAAGQGPADGVAEVVRAALCQLAVLFPGTEAEPSQLNVVLTDGQTLLATRWGHSLFWLERRNAALVDRPVEPSPAYHALAVASEPTTAETAWTEIPDHAVFLIRPDFTHAILPITAPAR